MATSTTPQLYTAGFIPKTPPQAGTLTLWNCLSVIAFPPSFSWLEPAGAAADRGHSTGAAWNWHPFAGGHTPSSKVPQFCRDRGGGTDGSNPLSSSGESGANLKTTSTFRCRATSSAGRAPRPAATNRPVPATGE